MNGKQARMLRKLSESIGANVNTGYNPHNSPHYVHDAYGKQRLETSGSQRTLHAHCTRKHYQDLKRVYKCT